jgi:hypothetical protein
MDTSAKDAIFPISPYTLPKLRTYKGIVNKYVIDNVELDQSYYWTPQWQKGEIEADNDIKENKLNVFNSSSEAIDYLHKLRDDSNKNDQKI